VTAPAPADAVAWPLAVRLRACVETGLAGALAGPPGTCCVVPGRDVALDDCCAGQAWVRILRVYGSSMESFPDAARQPHDTDRCTGGRWAVEFGAGVVRCVPGLDGRGQPPTGAELEASAGQVADDASRIRRAVLCCFADGSDEGLWVGDWLPVGPEGGCVGGELSVVVGVDGCECAG